MSHVRRLLLLAFGCTVCFLAAWSSGSAASQAAQAGKEAESTPPAGERVAALKITTANGSWYLRLGPGGATDMGPVRLPVRDERCESVLVSMRQERDHVVVTLSGEKGELDTVPIGRYELPVLAVGAVREKSAAVQGEDAHGVTVHELDSWKSGPWQIELAEIVPNTQLVGCCGCSAVQSCPKPGRCMDCSDCGQCCHT